MSVLRRWRNFVKQLDVPLYFVSAALGSYLAIGAILRTAKIPTEKSWSFGEPLFWGLVVCAVWVPIYTLYKSLDAYFESHDLRLSEARRDLTIACQKAVSRIADACPVVAVNDLAAFVWRCETEAFEEIARFYLPHDRRATGVQWKPGKGVAGMAWATRRDLHSDLTVLVDRMDELGPADFDALSEGERLGMTALELETTRDRTGVCAILLFGSSPQAEPVGLFVLEYSGESGFDCVSEQVAKRGVSELLAGCEGVLTEVGRAL